MEIDKKKALNEVRDMTPYIEILTTVAMFFKPGEHIDILEIGVRRGVSTKAILRGLLNRWGTGHLYSVDITDRADRYGKEEYKPFWTFIQGDSKTIDWDRKIDILFIDGDHSFEGVKADYERFISFVNDGGIVMFHDVLSPDCQVSRFWQEYNFGYSHIVLPLNKEGLGILIKING